MSGEIQAPPMDPGNPYLRHDYGTSLQVSVVTGGAIPGPLAALTWRSANATLTVLADVAFLDAILADVQKVRQNLAAAESGLVLPAGLIVPGRN